ncbi:hypothetical protein AHMF7605_03550 [Adhaeribacter arboris]|uniref:STAS/SEC14 domain-containing protein n=1 Tax=Adhaeribacter arboris TaxID=2072846 RepID=A0A2T2YAY4_9BACT|nr:hypothetical protein [Adhaeribacter arboris]PSR52664.1 hypothetical protein AHMF7605_03550 [Adhaeribacter arboris]
MERKELKKFNGDLFFEVQRKAANSYIFTNWVGIQTLETILLGTNQVLDMLRKEPSTGILNSNRELIGPWDDGALYMGNKWVMELNTLGVIHFAHVLAPGIYGQRSFEKFFQLAQPYLQIEVFNSNEEAESWLLS